MASPRIVRLNQLVYQELNTILHTLFRDSAAKISITEVSLSPDLYNAHVYFSVIGDENDIQNATKFLLKNAKNLCQALCRRIRLRCSPQLNFKYDDSIARGQNILAMLDSL
ncbi:MAG: 30S ribosome-binding factor RbfA [Puniceicoccales bacterium]|jgi:ribosome-binding factor A|nr:30S ribosome-binding factor RbfA [Puniceicoccales bacterium]